MPFQKGHKHSDNWYKKMKGRIPWNKGLSSSGITSNLGKYAKKGVIPWNRGTKGVMKAWNKGKKYSKEIKEKLKLAHIGKHRLNNGSFKKGLIFSKDQLKKILRRRKISSLEKRVIDVIEKYNLPYKFVGNGKFFIERKNPDFININGEKKAIEVYAKRHKDKFRVGLEKWKSEREIIFKRYGWSIIFIEDWQTNKEETILKFLKGGD